MTTQQRLLEAARYLRTQHPRPSSNGEYIDELMQRAAKELDEGFLLLASITSPKPAFAWEDNPEPTNQPLNQE